MSVEEKLKDLENRVAHQESMHPDITMTKSGVAHGIFNNTPFLITAVFLSVVITVLINRSIK